MASFEYAPTRLSESEESFRTEVRAFIARHAQLMNPSMLGMTGVGGHDAAFSELLGRQGWLGLTIAKEAGGHGRTFVERFVLTEELLAAQAPVSAHWFADRQSAPVIARYGTEAQQARFIPDIVAGRLFFSIGMSEPDAGSDLARVRTRAVRVPGGFSVSGTKVWTTLAHRNHWLILLCRTDPEAERHDGLTQLLVDLSSPGVSVRPILTMDGEADFCEVVLSEVFVPDDLVLGQPGQGWRQVVGELAFERSGPDRYLSAWPLVERLIGARIDGSDEAVGRLAARYRVVRQLALSLARSLDAGLSPAPDAALMKDIGTVLEQDSVEAARLWLGGDPDPDGPDPGDRLLASAILNAPTFTLRGGTKEILRGMITRAAGGPSTGTSTAERDPVLSLTSEILAAARQPASGPGADGDFSAEAWSALSDAGLPLAGIASAYGGSDGTIRDAASVVRAAAMAVAPLPVAETALVAGVVLAKAGQPVPAGPLTVAVDHDLRLRDGRLTGRARRVPFASSAAAIVAIDGDTLVTFQGQGRGRALSGEPREDLELRGIAPAVAVPAPVDAQGLRDMLAAARAVQIAGATRAVLGQAVEYTAQREQFGQPLIRLQAIAQQIALLCECAVRAEAAAEFAIRWLEGSADRGDLMVATVTAREAATQAAAIAHQVHGAIGIAAEYGLHRYTRRLWSWRDEAGAERDWAVALGRAAFSEPAPWAWISR
jgi:alkylation response protein AidB-like acyl-CoA dehydrogenase